MLKFPDGYLVKPRCRWGFGQPVHGQIWSVLDKSRGVYDNALKEIEGQRLILHEIDFDRNTSDAMVPYWNNAWFSTLDAASLVGFLLSRNPKHYVEIGSGLSTLFAAYAISRGRLRTTITSIDPTPRRDIDAVCDTVVRRGLEDCPFKVFDELEQGDVLFFDGSHRIFTNSDVSVFFLEVLPRLTAGILVHVHDIFLPSDYPSIWNARFYSEQYILAAMLCCGAPPFRIVLPNFFLCNDPALSPRVRELFKAEVDQGRDIPFNYGHGLGFPGVSFWFETTPLMD